MCRYLTGRHDHGENYFTYSAGASMIIGSQKFGWVPEEIFLRLNSSETERSFIYFAGPSFIQLFSGTQLSHLYHSARFGNAYRPKFIGAMRIEAFRQ